MSSLIHVSGRDVRIAGRFLRIARLDADKFQFLDDPEPMLRALRTSGFPIDLFTFMQRLPETSPKHAYPMEWDNLAVLPVSTFNHWWTQQIGFKARNKAKQAEKKGVTLREVPFDEALVQGIWEIYNECPVRQGKHFAHYGMSLERVRGYAGTFLNSSIFIGASLGQELIGFAKLTCDETRTQANLMHIVSMIRQRDKAPTNALIAQAVRSCAERGIPYLVYSNFSYGKKQRDGLSDFKERNGFQQIDLPRYYVPLTRTGWAAFRLGLHRRFVDHLPEPVAAKLRALRKAFYRRIYESETEA
ncbi:MAG: hypothetical protein ABSC05_38560 [Candidatus Solibacter sp.]|jgi:hypothetical protein